MESRYLSVRFLRQTIGINIILLHSLLCLHQAPGQIHPPDYLHLSMIVITVAIEGVRDRQEETFHREKIDRGHVIGTLEEEEERGVEVEKEIENAAEAGTETVVEIDIVVALEVEKGAPVDEMRYQTERKCVFQVQKTEKVASHLELSGSEIFRRETAPKKVSKT